jgi:hypothetical protein
MFYGSLGFNIVSYHQQALLWLSNYSGVSSRPSRICLLDAGQPAIPKGRTKSLTEDIDSASDVCLARRDLQSRDPLTLKKDHWSIIIKMINVIAINIT